MKYKNILSKTSTKSATKKIIRQNKRNSKPYDDLMRGPLPKSLK